MKPTTDAYDWGRDPQVRAMRRIYGLMETLQKHLFEQIGISPFDERLGRWRKPALRMFEQQWTEMARRGGPLGEEDVARTYLDCLVKVLTKDGVTVSDAARAAVDL